MLALFPVVLFLIAWLIAEWGRVQLRNEKEYESDYWIINKLIDQWEVNKTSCDNLQLRIDNLKRLAWKNKEKTDVLIQKFCKKFAKVRCEKHLNEKRA